MKKVEIIIVALVHLFIIKYLLSIMAEVEYIRGPSFWFGQALPDLVSDDCSDRITYVKVKQEPIVDPPQSLPIPEPLILPKVEEPIKKNM